MPVDWKHEKVENNSFLVYPNLLEHLDCQIPLVELPGKTLSSVGITPKFPLADLPDEVGLLLNTILDVQSDFDKLVQ